MRISYIRNGLCSSKEKQTRLFIFSIIFLNSQFSIPNHLFGLLHAQLHSCFELMELCTSTANGSLGFKEIIIEQNPTWPLSDWKEKGREVPGEISECYRLPGRGSKAISSRSGSPSCFILQGDPHPICSARTHAGNILAGTGT